jgi:hypothetical protein
LPGLGNQRVSHLYSFVKQLLKIWGAFEYGGIFWPAKFCIQSVSHSWRYGDMSEGIQGINQVETITYSPGIFNVPMED